LPPKMPVRGRRLARRVRQMRRQALRRSIPQPRSWVRRPRARQLLRKTFVAKPRASRLLRSMERPEQPVGATRWIRPTGLWSMQELSTGRGKKPNAWTASDRPRSSPDLGKALDLHPRASQSRDRKGIAYYEIASDAGRAQGLPRTDIHVSEAPLTPRKPSEFPCTSVRARQRVVQLFDD
jgi:hypothetical protein